MPKQHLSLCSKVVMMRCTAAGEPLELTGLDAEGMELLIEWVYGNFKPSLAYKQRMLLFHASHRFHVRELQLECERALKNSLSLQTYPELADLARKFNCQELEQVGCQVVSTLSWGIDVLVCQHHQHLWKCVSSTLRV